MNDSVFDRLVKILDTNFGFVDEEPAEKVADRLIQSGLLREKTYGTWKRVDYLPCGHDYICSECGDKHDEASHYCPNCGADMKLSLEELL